MTKMEMIKDLINCFNEYSCDYGSDYAIEKVLGRAESRGMLPPESEVWLSLNEAYEFYGESFDSDDIQSYPRKNLNRWETDEEE